MTSPITLKIRMKKLGILIKDARLTAGKSIDDCSRMIGVSSEKIEAFEMGNHAPSLPELETLAYFLDVPLTHFWGHHSLSARRPESEDIGMLQRLVPLRTRIVSVLLRKARLESGLSLRDLAELSNIPQHEIQSYEDGKTQIPLPKLESMASVLNLDIDYFFDKNGIVGKWSKQRKAVQEFFSLPSDLQNFVIKPVNKPYLEIAQKLSGMSVEQLRTLAEGLLDITL